MDTAAMNTAEEIVKQAESVYQRRSLEKAVEFFDPDRRDWGIGKPTALFNPRAAARSARSVGGQIACRAPALRSLL